MLCITIVACEKEDKFLGIEGMTSNKSTIGSRKYPYVAEVYAVIRADEDKSSMAYKMHDWLQTPEGKKVIRQSGYVTD